MEHVQEGGVRTPYGAESFAEAVNGFQPQYVLAPRLVGRLACGELAVEPVLGPARVAAVRRSEQYGVEGGTAADDEGYVHVTWGDERGPGAATGRYPADRSFEVRMPDLADRLLVRRGIDQANWYKREITDDTARVIAGHLHAGKLSALHTFMVDGSIGERLYDELESVAEHRQYAREWVDAPGAILPGAGRHRTDQGMDPPGHERGRSPSRGVADRRRSGRQRTRGAGQRQQH